MYNTIKETRKFDTDDRTDMADYDEIINNPLCTVVSERKEKLRDETRDAETGNITRLIESVILVVTWETKVLI